MLIIEGADNLGKTTAAQRIVNMANDRFPKDTIVYRHMGRPPSSWRFTMEEYSGTMNPYYVQDRFHLGGMIWHQPPDPYLTRGDCRAVEDRLKSIGGYIVIFVSSDLEWFEKRTRNAAREEMFNPDKIIEANAKYLDLIESCRVHYDYIVDVGPDQGFPTKDTLNLILNNWRKAGGKSL